MPKNLDIARTTKTGRFLSEPLGRSKASKFSLVEGMALNAQSERTAAGLEARGLKGPAYRAAICGSFQKKRG